MISTITLTLNLENKTGRVTDTTDYSGLIAPLSQYGAQGLGTISFQGNIIESYTTVGNPLIDLSSGDTYFEFPLELDVNGEVANGVYEVNYSLYLTNLSLGPTITATNLPSTIEVAIPEMVSDFLQPGNAIDLSKIGSSQGVTIASVNYVSPSQTFITFNEVINDPAYTTWYFYTDNLQAENLYTYAGCQLVSAKIGFNYDCEYGTNGTFSVSSETQLTNQTVVGLSAIINYPAWTSTTPNFNSQIITTSLPYSNNALATGTYGVTLYQAISQTQNDGLIIQYTASTSQEFNVSCVGSLCNLIPCIESLRNAHSIELQRNRISKYQVYVDNVLLYYAEAQNYRNCGELDKYREALGLLEAQLDASGCECGCCDPDTYVWVNNNAASTIDTLVNAIQFRLNPAGVPTQFDDETKGVQIGAIWEDTSTLPAQKGKLYVCTNNALNNASWIVYYDPNASVTAATISATPGTNLTSTNVQGQLTQADVLFSSLNGDNGITRVGDDFVLGGALTGNTTIDATGYSLKISSTSGFLPLKVEGSSIPFESKRVTGAGGNQPYTLLQLTGEKTTAGNGYGGSLDTTLSVSSTISAQASSIITKWLNSGVYEATLDFQTSSTGNVMTSKLSLNADGSVRVPYYGTGLQAGTPTYNLGVNGFGTIVETPAVKVYAALLTQVGTSDPTVVVVSNTTGETLTWDRVGPGQYRCTATGTPFTSAKSIITVCYGAGGTDYPGGIQSYVNTTNTAFVLTTSLGPLGTGPAAYADGMLTFASVKIEIYP